MDDDARRQRGRDADAVAGLFGSRLGGWLVVGGVAAAVLFGVLSWMGVL